jgi:hypothetical protein
MSSAPARSPHACLRITRSKRGTILSIARPASACGTHYQLKEIGRSASPNAAIAAAAPVTYAAALFCNEALLA